MTLLWLPNALRQHKTNPERHDSVIAEEGDFSGIPVELLNRNRAIRVFRAREDAAVAQRGA